MHHFLLFAVPPILQCVQNILFCSVYCVQILEAGGTSQYWPNTKLQANNKSYLIDVRSTTHLKIKCLVLTSLQVACGIFVRTDGKLRPSLNTAKM